MGPQRGTEPGVENVLISLETGPFELRNPGRIIGRQTGLQCRPSPRSGRGVDRQFNLIPIKSGIALELLLQRCGTRFIGLIDGPDRNPMPPPKLPTDAPVSLFTQPIQIRGAITLGIKGHPIVQNRVDRRLGQRLHLHEPLFRQIRLDRCFGTIAVLERNLAIFDFFEMSQGFHLGYDGVTSHQPV